MTVHSEPMMTWLRRQRRTVELELELMAFHFDLDGALGAGQLGLAWLARQDLLIAAIELHLRERGSEPASGADRPERICLLMRALATSDARLADDAWRLLDEPIAPGIEQIRQAVARSLTFMTRTLGVPAAQSRDTAMRAWADAIALLRSVARSLGVAQAEDWYLSDSDTDGHLGWYDEVMNLLESSAGEPVGR